MASKRKRMVLTLKEKLEIVKLVDRRSSYKNVAARFNIGKSTVNDVYKARGLVNLWLSWTTAILRMLRNVALLEDRTMTT